MTKLFLSIYDYLSKHKAFSIALMLVLLGGCVLMSLRLRYKENATEFLPQNEENAKYIAVYNDLAGQGRVTILFRGLDADEDERRYAILDAVEHFQEAWDSIAEAEGLQIELQSKVDENKAIEAMDYMRENIACFLTEEDYARMDSLLADPEYVATSLANVKQLLSFPMGAMAQDAIVNDPLNLFSPALQRLSNLSASDRYEVDEGVLFDTCGVGYAYAESPWDGNDTKNNARLAKLVDGAIAAVAVSDTAVKVSAVGTPLIALTNANQIKKDSIIAILLSVVLIAAILIFALKRKRNILLLGLSVTAGWLFALALMALFRPEISIIIIGIGSVLVGIAVNYPLHYLDHLVDHPDKRETLKEMVEPLVTGNITTVSAFACLVFVKAEAMRDLGVFGALMLVGTILFVMIFLPLLAKAGKRKFGQSAPMQESAAPVSEKKRKIAGWTIIPVAIATIVLGVLSTRTEFDSDLHNINYMTQQQKDDIAMLNASMEDSSVVTEYLVSTSPTLEDALESNKEAMRLMSDNSSYKMSGAACLIPSVGQQERSIERWGEFVKKHPDLSRQVSDNARRIGFSAEAFQPFCLQLQKSFAAIVPDSMEALCSLSANYIMRQDGSVKLVTMVRVPAEQSQQTKESLRSQLEGGTFVFDISDVGMNLVEALNEDFNYILYVCGFVVFFFLWLSLGRLELAVLSFLPMAVGWLWILGIMDLASVKFNIVNIILATFIFGQGDDYTIFITEGLLFENAYGKKRLKGYRRSVIISALLMFVGIGSLIFAKHPAMRSLAEVAIIGMASVVLMACYLPQLIFTWLTERKGVKREVPITFGRLCKTLFVLLVFFVVTFVGVTPYTVFYKLIGKNTEKKKLRYHRMMQRLASTAIRHLPGVKFSVKNSSGEDFGKPAIIVANHQSHLDLLCILQMTPKLVILTNDWVWKNPIYGLAIRYAEFFPVSNGYDAILPKLQDLVSRGYSIMVFPEGTRSLDGEIGRFHKGAFQLAQQLQLDIVPTFVHGAYHAMPKNDILLRKGAVTLEIQQRIPYGQICGKETRKVASEVHGYYVEHYAELALALEDEAYCLPRVRYQYLFKGRQVEQDCSKAIKRYLATREFVLGNGEIALLKALSHRDVEYEYVFDDEDCYRIASNCVAVPSNLHYKLKEN